MYTPYTIVEREKKKRNKTPQYLHSPGSDLKTVGISSIVNAQIQVTPSIVLAVCHPNSQSLQSKSAEPFDQTNAQSTTSTLICPLPSSIESDKSLSTLVPTVAFA
ncbi:hypothetical protein J3458_001662 [Metarhizium acridum]|uniref:uncharacterized protein n=1 Tax=Metarhizium acridum TaxID=92637 RepID=UPI001C6BE8D0|nr:hypothetical protein J3458_001662 [Metarhizium acridum]